MLTPADILILDETPPTTTADYPLAGGPGTDVSWKNSPGHWSWSRMIASCSRPLLATDIVGLDGNAGHGMFTDFDDEVPELQLA